MYFFFNGVSQKNHCIDKEIEYDFDLDYSDQNRVAF